MRILFLLLLSVFFLNVRLYAQTTDEVDPIDRDYKVCMSKDTSITTVCNCAFEAYAKWNDRMELYYKKLMREVKNDTAKQIAEKAQGAWLTWRDTEFGTYNCIFDKGGTKWSRVRAEERLNMMRERAQQLKAYYDVLHNNRQ